MSSLSVCICICIDTCTYIYIYIYVLSCFSHVWFFETLWTVACQAPLSMGFSRQEYWSRLPCPPPGDLPHPGIKPTSLMSLEGRFFSTSATWEGSLSPSPSLSLYIYMYTYTYVYILYTSIWWLSGKEFSCQCKRLRFGPGSGNGNLLQYSCLGSPMDREVSGPSVCKEPDRI